MRMPPPRSYSLVNPTPNDLYLSKSRLSWYFTSSAITSSWLALAGYILFCLVFTSELDNLRTSRGVITTLASCGLVFGYGGGVATALLSRNVLFSLETVVHPLLTSSAIGLFAIAMNYVLHVRFDNIPNKSYIFIPLIVACVTTIMTAAATYLLHRKVIQVKQQDERRRATGHIPLVEQAQNQSPNWLLNNATGAELEEMLPDDEAQRQQLLRLLLAKNDARAASTEDTTATYKINLPWNDAQETHANQRSGSVPPIADSGRGRWTISNMLGRQRSDGDYSQAAFKDPRERRREEIERASILASSASPDPGGLYARSAAWHGQEPGGSSTWHGEQAARYA